MLLRDYQQRALSMLLEAGRERPIIAMPVGSGKTVVFSTMVRLAWERKRKRSLVIAHRRELIMQAQGTLEAQIAPYLK